jgi:hypothetical protein
MMADLDAPLTGLDAVADDAYTGRALIRAPEVSVNLTVTLAGRFEPVDGRYHWGGRAAPDARLAGLVRDGVREVTIQIGSGADAPAHLVEIDPWGGVRVRGLGRPPWTAS